MGKSRKRLYFNDVSSVAREVGEYDTKLWRVLDYHVTEALKGQDFSNVTGIGVDEYITVFVSHPDIIIDDKGNRKYGQTPRVLFVTEGKDKAAVERFLARFKEKKGIVENVKVSTSDMVHGFKNVVKSYDSFYSTHGSYDEGLCCDFEDLVLSLCSCAIHEINKLGKMLARNAVEILNHFETKRTNAILEGFNSKISIIKNRARGFCNMDLFLLWQSLRLFYL